MRKHIHTLLSRSSSEPTNPSGCKHTSVRQGVVMSWVVVRGWGGGNGETPRMRTAGGKGGVSAPAWAGGAAVGSSWRAPQQANACAYAFVPPGQMQREHLLIRLVLISY